jgi:hypothetical protein
MVKILDADFGCYILKVLDGDRYQWYHSDGEDFRW